MGELIRDNIDRQCAGKINFLYFLPVMIAVYYVIFTVYFPRKCPGFREFKVESIKIKII